MKAEPAKLEEPQAGKAKLEVPKAGKATPKLVNSLGLYRKLRKIKRELSDPKAPKSPPRFAEWNYKERVAETLVDGNLLATKNVRPSHPALKGESRMIAMFEGGLELEVAAAWFWMASPPLPSSKTPVFRPIKLKTGQKIKAPLDTGRDHTGGWV